MGYDKKYAKEIKRYKKKIANTKEKAKQRKRLGKINDKNRKKYDDKINGTIADFILDLFSNCTKDSNGRYHIIADFHVKFTNRSQNFYFVDDD